MRLKLIRRPRSRSIDGIRLDLFEPGHEYEVGQAVGALLLAEGWAVPVVIDDGPSAHGKEIRGRFPAQVRQRDVAADRRKKRKARR